jgi:hypothetical protein
MNEIYFTNKGHTIKLNIPNIWPNKYMGYAAPELFIGKKLVLLIDPVMVDKSYYIANFSVFDAERVSYTEPREGHPLAMISSPFLWASLIKGVITITTKSIKENLLNIGQAEKERFWGMRSEALDLLKLAVDEFTKYFPEQRYR